jgi:hypothetical protein
MKRIYIAGKYSDTGAVNVLQNIRLGIETAVEKVLLRGDIPFCPFLDCLFVLFDKDKRLTSQHFRDYSMSWLEVCDEVWFLPNWVTSKGCEAELKRARELGKVVIYL